MRNKDVKGLPEALYLRHWLLQSAERASMPRPQERPLKINTKRLSRAQSKLECAGEISAFFSCMTVCIHYLMSLTCLIVPYTVLLGPQILDCAAL